ncbi:TRAP transporter substrate-binding protein [Shinella pollutisoli]|uniref:TRAP transporter substrate-binding protein n=1 Tax=Shinella pollutisoli TaxID=2250594 RepID=A0ABV7DGI2_9HYPH|nr:TRAP transporter substrate-binding protein [Shinella pollutisoli]
MLTRRRFAATLLFTPALVGRVNAATRLTVASLLGEDKPETLVWHHIRDQVEAALPGRFAFAIVANAALGGEKEVAEAMRLGAVQASLFTVSALAGWAPEVQLLDLPFLFRDADHVRAVVSGPEGGRLKDLLVAQGFVAPDFIDYGARHLLTKTPVTRPEEIAGKRIRVLQSPLHTRLWSAFGATPVGIPIPETYNALQTGVADAMDLTKSAYAGFRLYEVVPFLTETGHIRASGVVAFSAAFWNGLSEEERAVFRAASRAGAARFNALMVADEERSIALAQENGATVLQPEDRAAWEAGARGVWQDFAETVGGLERIEAVRSLG